MNLRYSPVGAFAFFCALSTCSSRATYAAPPPDPCAFLSQEQLGTVLGTSVEAAQHVARKLCQLAAPNQPNSVNAKKVAIIISNERAFGYAKTPIVSSVKPIPGSGVCDDAVYAVASGVTPGPNTSLYVKKGDSYFVVHVYGFPDQSKVMAMEKTLATQASSKL